MMCYAAVYSIHHDPDLWHNPQEFNPHNFDEEVVAQRHPYAFMPFGAGRRVCIGKLFALEEMNVAVAYLISTFDFKLPKDAQPVTPKMNSFLLAQSHDFSLIFTQRMPSL